MISEKTIEAAAESIGSQDEKGYQKILEEFKVKHPVVLAYLFSENLDLLTKEERNILLYLILVVRKSYLKENRNEPTPASEDLLENAEDRNWTKLVDNKESDFRERLSPFFEGTRQEDLLAFFEDILMDEEEETVTKAGREYIFVAAKTVVDVWCRSI
jgi:hypothetical protein